MPVLYAAGGNCHVYVHADADLEMARRIAYNAKVDRPGVCNAAETLLVDESGRRGVPARRRSPTSPPRGSSWSATGGFAPRPGRRPVGEATEADWDTEYHGMKMAVGVVDSLDDAIEHVNQHGTGHTEAIVTGSRRGGAGVHRRGRRGGRLRQRLDPLHRRLRVRDGGGDRQLDPEAARARPDRAARADDHQVRRPRRRTGAGVAPSPVVPSGSSAAPSTRRTSAISCSPRRRRTSSASTRCVLVPTGSAPHKRIEPEPGPGVRLRDDAGWPRRATSCSRSPIWRSQPRARPTPFVRWRS